MAASFPGSVKSFGADRVDGGFIPADDMNTVRAEVVALETELLLGGWISEALTWAYASASTFTIAGDHTARFTKGVRLKWTQGTVKYGVVLSSAYGAPNTTVTIAVNVDYVITNAVISLAYTSNVAEPRGWPGWFAYTAALVGFSANPTFASRYRINGNTCSLAHRETASGTSNATGFTVSLPVAAAAAALGQAVACADAANNSAYTDLAEATITAAGTTAVLTLSGSATGFTNSGTKRASFQMVYEI